MIDLKGNIKDCHILFDEIKKRNPNYKGVDYIYDIYEKIKKYYSENIKKITDIELKRKIKEIKSQIIINKEDINSYIQLISVMIKVNGKIFRYKPREIQIISVLFFLFKEKNSGLIEEIYTGEGK